MNEQLFVIFVTVAVLVIIFGIVQFKFPKLTWKLSLGTKFKRTKKQRFTKDEQYFQRAQGIFSIATGLIFLLAEFVAFIIMQKR